ncbi:MOSC domain-containing protein [Rhizobium sp. AAP43]|uniref:MOSC domain-containing protein n=1 Tax=Rhizobium sp. AAP43 TaxID=1523420 RepID=UPI0006B9187B|nr:MOSC domain-containing protein [Rhizobium sp. AAP43]KPF47437.1 hypothetical protein IP76_01410 [Rhizobium sp. AAP43]
MRRIGHVKEIWRYPVSSVGGQRLDALSVSPAGIEGDRRFALFDPLTGLSAAPERDPRWRPALFLQAMRGETAHLPQLRFPDGSLHWLDDAHLDQRLLDHFGFAAHIGAYGGLADGADMRFPVVSNRYTPAPLHLVTTASLTRLSVIAGLPPLDAQRFRPSVLIETEETESGFVENAWVGSSIRIGAAKVRVTEASRRCGMTMIAQPGMNEQPEILRGIMRHNARNLGVYAGVEEAVTLAVGDPVYAGI